MRGRFLDPLTLVLATGCAGLGLLLLYQARTSPFAESPPAAVAAPDSPEIAGLRSWSMPPAADFAATLARPLFAEGRRPPRVEDAIVAPQAGAADLPLALTAIVLAPQRRIALVERRPGGTLFLSEGDDIDGWTVIEVGFEHLLLGAGGRTRQVLLRDLPATDGETPPANPSSPVADAPAAAAPMPAEAEQRLVDGRLVEILPEHSGITEGGILTAAPAPEPESALQ